MRKNNPTKTLYKMIYSQEVAKSILSALRVRHIPPSNFFMKSLLKKTIYPRYIKLELTHKCNLKCLMCPTFLHNQVSGRKELSFEEIKTVLNELSSYRHKPYVSISGGEPFLRPDIFDILQYLESLGLKYKILTNATVILPESAKKIKLINPEMFQVSLDGPEQIHDKIRQARGAFLKTIETIKYIKENTSWKVLIMCIINSLNSVYLEETVKIARDLRVDVCFGHLSFIGLNRFRHQKEIMEKEFGVKLPDSRCNDINDLHNLNASQLVEQIAMIQGKKTGINVYFTQQLSSEQIAMHYADSECPVFSDRCYYPWFGARINPYGEVSICKDDCLGVGNILEKPLLDLYNNYRSGMFREYLKNSLLPLCSRCCWCGSGDSMTTVFSQQGNLT